ncbi:MAG: 50S ribosomal protein L24 [Porphyromonas sp.]|nr:50S ribosomal protein L24 [Porphyromonas sp.]MDY5859187.1 50S ribosomal protein L24 [Porphyromonas sp.]
MSKLHIKKGDQVLVLAGKDKGVKAEVLKVLVDKQRALVKGVNVITKHAKPSAKNPQGGIEKSEAPIHISNLMVINPETGKAARVGRARNEAGKLVRVFKNPSKRKENN